MSHGDSSARATRIGSAPRAAGASANSSHRSSNTCARLIRRPARGAVRGPARARASLRGAPLPPAQIPARSEGTRALRPRSGQSAEALLDYSAVAASLTGSPPIAKLAGRGRGVGPASRPRARPGTRSSREDRAGIRPARVFDERSEEFARAPRPAAAKPEAGRRRGAGGRGTHHPARGPPRNRRDVYGWGPRVLPQARRRATAAPARVLKKFRTWPFVTRHGAPSAPRPRRARRRFQRRQPRRRWGRHLPGRGPARLRGPQGGVQLRGRRGCRRRRPLPSVPGGTRRKWGGEDGRGSQRLPHFGPYGVHESCGEGRRGGEEEHRGGAGRQRGAGDEEGRDGAVREDVGGTAPAARLLRLSHRLLAFAAEAGCEPSPAKKAQRRA